MPRCAIFSLAALLFAGGVAETARAQERPDRRKTQTNIPPEQLVSFEPNTPLNQFIELVNPVFQDVADKPVVDPEDRSMPIGVNISGMHYLDALERVLEANELTYRETETAFLVQEPEQTSEPEAPPEGEQGDPLATLGSREIRIDAILFNLNLTRVRDLGLRWSALFPQEQGGQGGGSGGGGGTGGRSSGGEGEGQGQFFIRTDNLFESVDDVIQAPEQVTVGRFREFLNLLEQDDAGRTVANPQITVQSGEQGQIQIGQDVPVQTTDFAGNTVTQFFETGIIVDVTPTLITEPVVDTAGAPTMDFIHMDVRVEDSNSQPSSGGGPVINRNQANTQVLLLDEEATAIGGLITSQETKTRSGIPLLKDLPPWFFGLRYIFGRTNTNVQKQELLIVLKAEIVDPLRARRDDPADDEMIDERRRQAQEVLRRLGERHQEQTEFPQPETEPDSSTTEQE
ncbi:MAG: type II and III secretion system protein [Salinibacter sp.]